METDHIQFGYNLSLWTVVELLAFAIVGVVLYQFIDWWFLLIPISVYATRHFTLWKVNKVLLYLPVTYETKDIITDE